jgi:hypothetical protein
MIASYSPQALIDLHKKSVGTVTYRYQRYRQTPTLQIRTAHACGVSVLLIILVE